MTLHYDMLNARHGFEDLVKLTMAQDPQKVGTRMTYEVLGAQIELHDPLDALPTGIGIEAHINVPGAVQGALDLLAGVSPLGQRIRHQLTDAERLITTDPWSVAAICVAFDPMYDRMLPEPSPSIGEVIALQFVYRPRALHLHVFMRSADVMSDLALGMFQMGQLLATMSKVIQSPEIGSVVFHIGSLRIYSSDTSITDYLKKPSVPTDRLPDMPTGLMGETWESVVTRAKWLLERVEKGSAGRPGDLTDTEQWYLSQLIADSVSTL